MREKKYIIDNEELMKEWDWEKNNQLSLDPNKLTHGSNKKAYWKCRDGHVWQASINNRTIGKNCPYCSGRRVIEGVTDFKTKHPELMNEWNFDKNIGIDPSKINSSIALKVWWRCEKGHEWQASIYNRTIGRNCPYCSGRRVIEGETDFKTKHPELMNEWNFDKNVGIDPSKINSSIALKVWWKCEKGHEWQASINHRDRGTGCPICSADIRTSFPEKALYFYLSKIFEIESRKIIYGREIDLYIASLNLGIEYDGMYFHSNERKIKLDKEKDNLMKEKGVSLIRIKESNKEHYDLKNYIFYYVPNSQYSSLNPVIVKLVSFINQKYNLSNDVDVDVKRDSVEILKTYKTLEVSNSIGKTNPTLALEWNYEKNGQLVPEQFSPKSQFKVWWKCEQGHEWEAAVADRSRGKGCPVCAGKKVLKGFNDLETCFPEVAKEWNYEKNDTKPDEVVSFSDKKVWWKCNQGHEWIAKISSRGRGSGCPYCSGNKVLKGISDFKTWCITNRREDLLEEFDYSKNNFNISEIFPKGDIEVWWICPKGHSYSTQIKTRTRGKTSCPYCSHKKVLKGFNDMATTHPHIAKEWDYEKNGNVTPYEIMAGSNNKKYWFKCSKGHSYQSNPLNRKKGRGCPYCYSEKRCRKDKEG